MTDERDREPLDKLVSETYRELPAPRAPDHLNQAILRMAKKKGPGRAGLLFAAWVKPVTLAATIALSLAIVLELSEVPVTSEQMEVVPARDELIPQETDRLDEGLLEVLVLEETDLVKREAKGKIESFATSPPAPVLPAAKSTIGFAMEKNDSDATPACDKNARQSAHSWLDCIDQLRESGATLDADREYEAFMLEYPAESADPESNK